MARRSRSAAKGRVDLGVSNFEDDTKGMDQEPKLFQDGQTDLGEDDNRFSWRQPLFIIALSYRYGILNLGKEGHFYETPETVGQRQNLAG
jgi:hypothetical protein